LAEELEDRDYYKEVNVFWVPETARWEALRAAAKQPNIGKQIDDALSVIEVENPKLKGILDKRYARAQLPAACSPAQGSTGSSCALHNSNVCRSFPSQHITSRQVLHFIFEAATYYFLLVDGHAFDPLSHYTEP
jgi:hypothetical protein